MPEFPAFPAVIAAFQDRSQSAAYAAGPFKDGTNRVLLVEYYQKQSCQVLFPAANVERNDTLAARKTRGNSLFFGSLMSGFLSLSPVRLPLRGKRIWRRSALTATLLVSAFGSATAGTPTFPRIG